MNKTSKQKITMLVASQQNFTVYHEWTGKHKCGWVQEMHPLVKFEKGRLFEQKQVSFGVLEWTEVPTPPSITPKTLVQVYIDPDDDFVGQLHVELL